MKINQYAFGSICEKQEITNLNLLNVYFFPFFVIYFNLPTFFFALDWKSKIKGKLKKIKYLFERDLMIPLLHLYLYQRDKIKTKTFVINHPGVK